jgi:hypothetical protein
MAGGLSPAIFVSGGRVSALLDLFFSPLLEFADYLVTNWVWEKMTSWLRIW